MIITTSDPKVATAVVVYTPIGLEVIVNTDRSMALYLQGSDYSANNNLMAYFWTFNDEDSSEKEVTIKVIPENVSEETLIKGVEYSSYDRGQFCFLLVNYNNLTSRTILATTSTEA
jgi:hypothetical protein